MTDQEKYYTPEISEFHVGFECEFKNNMHDNVFLTLKNNFNKDQ